MIEALVKQERIAQIGKARDADDGWRKDVSLLRDKILRSIVFAHRKTGDVGARRRKGIGRRTAAIHVAEIQRVLMRKIVIEFHSELVGILAQGLRADESIFSLVRQRKKRRDIRRY